MWKQENLALGLFLVNVVSHYLLLAGVLYSILYPQSRVWPPKHKRAWSHTVTWFLFYLTWILNVILIYLDWNSWLFKSNIRFYLGGPLILVGLIFVTWGIRHLGTQNTSGLKAGFVSSGPYRYMRNPQYFGDFLLFSGIILVSNSLYLLITHALTIFVFLLTPFTEETWLEEQYGEDYLEYKKKTARFL